MGRLFQWIRFAARARGASRRSAIASRRRRLAFERFESRIALSTADGDLTAADDYADQGEQWRPLDDGGAITISFTAADVFDRSTIAERFDMIPVGASTDFAIRAEAFVTILKSATANGVTREWNLSSITDGWLPSDGFQLFDSTSDGDYSLSLNGSELASPSLNSDLSVIPTPTPTEQPGAGGGNEGGQIALTPFVAPTGLTLSDGHGSSSIARNKPETEELRETPAPRTSDAGRLESLRGRAVVYEVADAGSGKLQIDEKSEAVDRLVDREAVQLAAFSELAPKSLNGRINRDAEPSGVVIEVPSTEETPADEAAFLAELSFNQLETDEAFTLNGDDVANSPTLVAANMAIDRDEVFADWQSAGSFDSPPAALAAHHDARDRRMLGIGVALALSFMPLRKAWRRRSDQAVQRELPWRRRRS